MAKIFTFRGYEMDKLKEMNLKEFGNLLKSKERRKIKRGLTVEEKKLLIDIKGNNELIRTHCRSMIIIPMMVGKTIFVHAGKEFVRIDIKPEMLGHRLGEFADTRKRIKHGAPGMGATRSSMYVPLK
jgi:small subunit ribosomal protein S19